MLLHLGTADAVQLENDIVLRDVVHLEDEDRIKHMPCLVLDIAEKARLTCLAMSRGTAWMWCSWMARPSGSQGYN